MIRKLAIQNLIVALPTLLFFAIGNIGMMITWFKATFTIIFIYHLIKSKPQELTSFLVMLFPLIFFLKGELYYYFITTILLLTTWTTIYIKRPLVAEKILLKKPFVGFSAFFVAYFFISYFNTGEYSSGLKFIDLVLAAGLIQVIYPIRKLFKTTFFYFGINAVIFGVIVGTYGARFLGHHSSILQGFIIGGANPIGYGTPVAIFLSLTLLVPEKVLPNKIFRNSFAKNILTALIILVLILTTSRGAMLAFLLSIFSYFILKGSLKIFWKYILAVFLGIALFSISLTIFPEFSFAQDFLVGRAKADDMNLNKYSDHRVEMWKGVGDELLSGNFIFIGTGPGLQTQANYITNFSMDHIFHSLVLKFIVEIGLILTLAFYFSFYLLFRKGVWKFKKLKFSLPLFGVIFWFGITLSVTGVDMMSGLAFGFAFLSREGQF